MGSHHKPIQTDAPSSAAPLPRAQRDVHVEILRLCAIVGIAIFHTFQPWFNSVAYGINSPAHTSTLAVSSFALFLLGCISLLGAMGNSIFYMISGYFLLPRMARQSDQSGYWIHQLKVTVRRVAVIAVSVALYAVIGLVLHQFFGLTSASLTDWHWAVGGLEFIWLYLIFMILAPFIGWAQARLATWPDLVLLLFVTVMGFNTYIAFWDQGSFQRGLFDWRKLMSAMTYLVAFLAGGVIAQYWNSVRNTGNFMLFAMIFLSLLAELICALSLDRGLMGSLSYKSTSVLSLLLAVAAVIFTFQQRDLAAEVQESSSSTLSSTNAADLTSASHPSGQRHHQSHEVAATIVRNLASGILGFYILQSLFSEEWHRLTISLLNSIMSMAPSSQSVPDGTLLLREAVPSGTFAPSPLGIITLFFLAGIGLSIVYALVILGFDLLIRRPVLVTLHLVR
jgi:peptidoglycan/LPS O-acetylase OafA/YrhL